MISDLMVVQLEELGTAWTSVNDQLMKKEDKTRVQDWGQGILMISARYGSPGHRSLVLSRNLVGSSITHFHFLILFIHSAPCLFYHSMNEAGFGVSRNKMKYIV